MSPTRVEIDLASVRARPGARINNAQAAVIAPKLFELEQRDGHLTPEAVLEDARSPRSPLHQFFEWDDSKAAEQHRLATARTLTRAVAYRVKVLEGDAAKYTPMFVRLREGEDEKPVYVPLTRAMASPSLRDQMLDNARRDLETWIRRYRTLTALANVMPLAEELAREVSKAA
jgi:hypothetical protein